MPDKTVANLPSLRHSLAALDVFDFSSELARGARSAVGHQHTVVTQVALKMEKNTCIMTYYCQFDNLSLLIR